MPRCGTQNKVESDGIWELGTKKQGNIAPSGVGDLWCRKANLVRFLFIKNQNTKGL